MDPSEPASFDHFTALLTTNTTFHFVDQKPTDYDAKTTLTLFCLHGFPDLWYGYRYQIGPWVKQGYRVVVPDMLGYGGTDMPLKVEEYSTKRLADHLAALLDYLNIHKAIVIGHDWGSYAAARFALWKPERTLKLILLSVPYTPPAQKYLSIQDIAKRFPNLSYQVYFNEDKAVQDIEQNLDVFIPLIFALPTSSHTFTEYEGTNDYIQGRKSVDSKEQIALNAKEIAYYKSQLQRGMFGPLAYYKTHLERYKEEQEAKLANISPNIPVLFIQGKFDPTATHGVIEKSRKLVPLLDFVELDAGHWLMVEPTSKNAVTRVILEWIDKGSKSNSKL